MLHQASISCTAPWRALKTLRESSFREISIPGGERNFCLDDFFFAFVSDGRHPLSQQHRRAFLMKVFQLHGMLAAGFRAGVGGTDQAVRKPVRVFENRFAVVLPYPKPHAAIDQSEAR